MNRVRVPVVPSEPNTYKHTRLAKSVIVSDHPPPKTATRLIMVAPCLSSVQSAYGACFEVFSRQMMNASSHPFSSVSLINASLRQLGGPGQGLLRSTVWFGGILMGVSKQRRTVSTPIAYVLYHFDKRTIYIRRRHFKLTISTGPRAL
jgi:hypothetical protein